MWWHKDGEESTTGQAGLGTAWKMSRAKTRRRKAEIPQGSAKISRQVRGRNLGVRWQSEARAATPPSEGGTVGAFPSTILSEGGVALTLHAALQGAARIAMRMLHRIFASSRLCASPCAGFSRDHLGAGAESISAGAGVMAARIASGIATAPSLPVALSTLAQTAVTEPRAISTRPPASFFQKRNA